VKYHMDKEHGTGFHLIRTFDSAHYE